MAGLGIWPGGIGAGTGVGVAGCGCLGGNTWAVATEHVRHTAAMSRIIPTNKPYLMPFALSRVYSCLNQRVTVTSCPACSAV